VSFIELVEAIAQKSGLPKATVRKVLTTFCTVVQDITLQGATTFLPKFGRFSKRVIKSRSVFGRMSEGRTTIKFKSFI
jgi:nucleoid DNA-binding protein